MQLSQISRLADNIVKSLLSCIKVLLLSRFRTRLPAKTKDKCIILANGPSLTDSIRMHSATFGEADLLCVNSFPLTEYFLSLKPAYYLFLAPEYWLDKMMPEYVKTREQIFSTLAESVNWNLTIFAPFAFKQHKSALKQLSGNKHLNIIFYNPTPIEGLVWVSNFLISLRLGMPRPHNVVVPSLINMIHCKYRNIILYGVDHSWLKELSVNENNEALLNQKHFYDMHVSQSQVMYKIEKGQKPRKLHEILEKFVHSFRSYHFIEQYARKKGVWIQNGTPGSFIDAFERC